jgi:hypothetical protein
MDQKQQLLLALATAITLCGCARNMPHVIGAPVLDSHFGEAVTRSREMQTIRPEGVAVSDDGYSGKAAQLAIQRHESSAKPAAPSGGSSAEANGKAGK